MTLKPRLKKSMYFFCKAVLLWNIGLTWGTSWTLQQQVAFVSRLEPSALLKSSSSSPDAKPFCTKSVSLTYDRSRDKTVLQLSKKKAAPVVTKKIQVKMLKYVEGTGHVGEIVMVTPAFFQNKLRPTGSAVVITDEEVIRQKAEAETLEKETRAKAEAIKEEIEQRTIRIRRKAGPDGHLFGGIGPKLIMEEVMKLISDDFLKQKSVKILSIASDDNSEIISGDIKQTGSYKSTISLTKDISGSFAVIVEAES